MTVTNTGRRRVVAGGVIAAVVLTAGAATMWLRVHGWAELDLSLGSPTVVEVATSGSPIDVIESALAPASGPVELDPLVLDAGLPVATSLARQPSAQDGSRPGY